MHPGLALRVHRRASGTRGRTAVRRRRRHRSAQTARKKASAAKSASCQKQDVAHVRHGLARQSRPVRQSAIDVAMTVAMCRQMRRCRRRSRAGRRREAWLRNSAETSRSCGDYARRRITGASKPVFLSVFDLFKIGIGPSSSHTMGPMTAAARFLDEILGGDWPRPAGAEVDRIGASLHGSLAYTGIGHGTDRAVILGLTGETPMTVDPDRVGRDRRGDRGRTGASRRPAIRPIASTRPPISCSTRRRRCPATPTAWPSTPMMPDDRLLLKRIYYSIGGGFVVSEEELQRLKARGAEQPTASRCRIPSPMPPRCWRWPSESGLSIAEMKRANEEIAHVARRARRRARRASGRRCSAASTAACRRTASCRAG